MAKSFIGLTAQYCLFKNVDYIIYNVPSFVSGVINKKNQNNLNINIKLICYIYVGAARRSLRSLVWTDLDLEASEVHVTSPSEGENHIFVSLLCFALCFIVQSMKHLFILIQKYHF